MATSSAFTSSTAPPLVDWANFGDFDYLDGQSDEKCWTRAPALDHDFFTPGSANNCFKQHLQALSSSELHQNDEKALFTKAVELNYKPVVTRRERLAKVADWTNLLNQNRLNKYATSGSFNFNEISELLGDETLVEDIKRPYRNLRDASKHGHGGKHFRRTNQPKKPPQKYFSQNQKNQTGYSKFHSSSRGQNSYHRRRGFKASNAVAENKLYPGFMRQTSAWQTKYAFDKSELEGAKPVETNPQVMIPLDISKLPSDNKNHSRIQLNNPMVLKNVVNMPLMPIEGADLESNLDLYDQSIYDSTNVFISADCLAALLANASSIHSFHINVDCLGPKSIHIHFDPSSYMNYATLCGSSAEKIANSFEKRQPGTYWNLSKESSKLNRAVRMLVFGKKSVDEQVYTVRKIKLGSFVTVQVLGYAHGKIGDTPVHVRTLLENPYAFDGKMEWKTNLESKFMSILLNENVANRFQMIRWHAAAMLSGVNKMALAFVTRTKSGENSQHSMLHMSTHDVSSFLQNHVGFKFQPGWDILKIFLKKVIKIASKVDYESSQLIIHIEKNLENDDNQMKCVVINNEVDSESSASEN